MGNWDFCFSRQELSCWIIQKPRTTSLHSFLVRCNQETHRWGSSYMYSFLAFFFFYKWHTCFFFTSLIINKCFKITMPLMHTRMLQLYQFHQIAPKQLCCGNLHQKDCFWAFSAPLLSSKYTAFLIYFFEICHGWCQ